MADELTKAKHVLQAVRARCCPTPKPWHGDPIDKPPMEYTPLPDPTPKPTEDEGGLDEYYECGGGPCGQVSTHPTSAGETPARRFLTEAISNLNRFCKEHDAVIRAKVFVEVAEMAVKRADLLRHNRDLCAIGGRSALNCFSDELRALTKEQADE